ncbi:MAG: ATP-binding protein [Solirubrobacteraceae bacterium]
MPVPIGPSVAITGADPVSSQEAAHGSQSPPRLNMGATVWDANGPLTPVALSDTERRFRFSGLPQAVGAARRSLREWEGYFEPDLFYDLSLCVSELVTKSVQHAQPASDDEIELVVSRHHELVRAEVMEHRPDVVVTQPAAMDGGDWGMFIVDRVADRWGVDRSMGTLLWCEIDLAEDGRSRDALPMSAGHPITSL